MLMAQLLKYPRGNPRARMHEIFAAVYEIVNAPDHRPIEMRRRRTGIELRRWNVRQFVIIYSYDPPSEAEPDGLVWIRAVRHSRVRNVFHYVRETPEVKYRLFH
jgi:hypothetical protein